MTDAPVADYRNAPRKGSVLAFDWGERRLGVAVGELELGMAHPLCTLQMPQGARDLAMLAPLLKEWQPVLAVVGLPMRTDGTPHPLARRCQAFARRLQHQFGVTTWMIDERYTSTAAEDLLKQAGSSTDISKQRVDQVAAQQILETLFELIARASRS